ncbi:MAG: AMP-binding protein, partial [Burkholderiales bacterium]|nr:AMP-binding protein [Burkholderiales bacterium]
MHSKPWLKNYPADVPHEIDVSQYPSLTELLEESFRKHAKSPVAVCMEEWMSYGLLDELSVAVGAWLQSQGLAPGARVALMMPNIPQFLVTMAAILRAGYTCVNVNPLYTPRELAHQLRDSGAEAIVILENFAATLEEVIAQTQVRHVVLASMGDLLGFWYGRWITFAVRHLAKMVPAFRMPLNGPQGDIQVVTFKHVLNAGQTKPLKRPSSNHDTTAFLQYTGGTTGLSKGAVLTHRNIIAAILQAEAWFHPATKRLGDPRKLNNIAALPLYHIFALTLSLLSIRSGAFMT